jgi:hypothetical protein
VLEAAPFGGIVDASFWHKAESLGVATTSAAMGGTRDAASVSISCPGCLLYVGMTGSRRNICPPIEAARARELIG